MNRPWSGKGKGVALFVYCLNKEIEDDENAQESNKVVLMEKRFVKFM